MNKPILPSLPVRGSVSVPGSKSITNRALVVAALADGVSTLVAPLDSDDTEAMVDCLEGLGVRIDRWNPIWRIQGTNGRFEPVRSVLDARASGTTARFITAVASLATAGIIVDGVPRMRQRPIGTLTKALRDLGGDVTDQAGYPPINIEGRGLNGGGIVMDGSASSQFISAVLMAAPYARSATTIELSAVTSRPYIDQTLEVMRAFGADAGWEDENTLYVDRTGYRAAEFAIEPDASAAVYPMAAAAVTGGSLTIQGLRRDSLQADLGVIPVLEAMGCSAEWNERGLKLIGTRDLLGVDVDMNHAPDAAVAVSVVALFARGATTIRNIPNLRIKETDRLAAIAAELSKLGAAVDERPDGLTIEPGHPQGASIATYDDHRIAMAFSVAGLRIPGVIIEDIECVSKTWPGYFDAMEQYLRPAVVAIDGPSGVGKSTVSRAVADRFGWGHLETGGYYRLATLAVLRSGADPTDPLEVAPVVESAEIGMRDGVATLGGEDVTGELRSDEVTANVSAVSAMPDVRVQLVAKQRAWVAATGPSVVEGRDIGTVVFDDAPLKIYLTATAEERARRRAGDLGLAPEELDDLIKKMRKRDEIDSTRKASPLRAADDAIVVDTSDLTIDEVVDLVAGHLEQVIDA